MFSPDGRWLAYMSHPSGDIEVHVRPFPGPGGNWQISTGGGGLPTWSPTRRELFYGMNGHIMVAGFSARWSHVPRGKGAALVRGALPDARNQPHVRPASRWRAIRAGAFGASASRRAIGQGGLHLQLLRGVAPCRARDQTVTESDRGSAATTECDRESVFVAVVHRPHAGNDCASQQQTVPPVRSSLPGCRCAAPRCGRPSDTDRADRLRAAAGASGRVEHSMASRAPWAACVAASHSGPDRPSSERGRAEPSATGPRAFRSGSGDRCRRAPRRDRGDPGPPPCRPAGWATGRVSSLWRA